jgi:tetratricopeptide (TPR) repeat protein
MSQIRLARISLILAAIGLNAAPAMLGMSAATAAEKAAPAPEAPKPDTVRPEMYKLIDPAQTKELLAAKNFAEMKNRLDQVAALPNLTPYEIHILNQSRVQLGSASGDNAMLLPALEAMVDSGRMAPKDKLNFINAAANIYYTSKDFDKALVWFNRYITEGGDVANVRPQMVRAYFFKNDFATAKTEVLKDIAASEAANKAPSSDELTLLGNIGIKTKDNGLYLQAIELLVKYYPTDAYWGDLISRTRGKTSYAARFDLDLLRLKAVAAPSKMEPEDYAEYAELALLGGFFTEAKTAMDKGYPGELPGGKDGAGLKKIRDQANKGAADDAKNIGAGEASAQKSKDGVGLVNLGYAYVTMGQYDKGIELMKQGIAKGVAKNPEDAKLRLGYAQALAGKLEDSMATLKAVSGNDGRGDLARYWIMWEAHPANKK